MNVMHTVPLPVLIFRPASALQYPPLCGVPEISTCIKTRSDKVLTSAHGLGSYLCQRVPGNETMVMTMALSPTKPTIEVFSDQSGCQTLTRPILTANVSTRPFILSTFILFSD